MLLSKVSDFFSPDNREMGQDIFTGMLSKDITSENGVINISDIRIVNKVGGKYSQNTVSQAYSDVNTKQIGLIDGTIFAQPNQSFQVKFDNKDIVIRLKAMGQPSVS